MKFKLFKREKRKICKNCWFYHKSDGNCHLARGINITKVWTNKYDTCKDFMR